MSVGAWMALFVGLALSVAALAWIWGHSNRPEAGITNHAGTESFMESTESREYDHGADRPAGPDAETMDPEKLGGGDHARPDVSLSDPGGSDPGREVRP